MTHRKSLRSLWCFVLSAGLILTAAAAGAEVFDEWLGKEIEKGRVAAEERVKAADREMEDKSVRAGVRSNRNQIETPALSDNSTSLLDTSSATDLLSTALNLAGLSGSTENDSGTDANSASVTASAYALYSAARQQDPLAPEAYCTQGARITRSFWMTLGFDDQQGDVGDDDDAEDDPDNPILVGAKLLLPLRGFRADVCDWKDSPEYAELRQRLLDSLRTAADAFDEIKTEVQTKLAERINALPAAERRALDAQCTSAEIDLESFNVDACSDKIREVLGDDANKIAAASFDSRLVPFQTLDEAILANIEALKRQPDLAASFTTKQRGDGADEYLSGLVFEYGIFGVANLTLNASHRYVHDGSSENNQGGRVAARIEMQPFPDLRLAGPRPLRFSLGGLGEWAQDAKPLYKGQLTLNLPIPFVDALSGLEIPLSLTIANRTEAIDEAEVRGTIGFTLDTAQILAEARRRFLAAPATTP